mgnify:CR=1 FL=1
MLFRSIAEGADVTTYALQCFGGAGAQLACRVAAALGMRTVMIHPLAGVLSAFGMGHARIQARRERAVERNLDAALLHELALDAAARCNDAIAEIAGQKIDPAAISTVTTLHLRYLGTDTALAVPMGSLTEVTEGFAQAHRSRFGFWDAGRQIVVEAMAVEAMGQSPLPVMPRPQAHAGGAAPAPTAFVPLHVDGRQYRAPVWRREALDPGSRITGPALVIEPNSTIVIDPGWTALYREDGNQIGRAHV